MPIGRREEIQFTGAFDFGVGAADPTMTEDGRLSPQVAVVVSEAGMMVTAVFTEAAARRLVAKVQEALDQGRMGLVLPEQGRR